MRLSNIGLYAGVGLIAFWMLTGGIAHILRPEWFYPIVPDIFPKKETVILSGIPELLIGVGILLPRTRALAGLGFAALCCAFLPLHIWDLFRDTPAITPQSAAIFRVFLQLGFITLGLWIYRRERSIVR